MDIILSKTNSPIENNDWDYCDIEFDQKKLNSLLKKYQNGFVKVILIFEDADNG